jgi:hypothetical protein
MEFGQGTLKATLDKRLEAKICCERFDALKMMMLELEGA